MGSVLYEAALEGSVPTLLELLQHDPLILDRVATNSLSETPLHVAAMLGHVDFVKEILRRKPELAEELDSRQYSALHIASQKGYVDMVKALLQANPDMCFARDVDGRNPLHLAAMKGRIDVLGELLGTRPPAASSTTIFGETIFHFCVKYNQLEALKFFLETMNSPEVLNAKDDCGMTILHLAVAEKQVEVIKFLTTRAEINVNALSANGFTALDILARSRRDVKDWEIGESLRRAGAISAKDNNCHLSAPELGTTQNHNSPTSHGNNQKQQGKDFENVHKNEEDWMEKMRSALMVVASLIATMAFHAASNSPSLGKYHSPDEAVSSEPSIAQASSYVYAEYFIPFGTFFLFNTIGFMASLSIIILLVSGLPLKRRLFTWILMVIIWVAVIAMALAYMAYIRTRYFFYEYEYDYYYATAISLWIISLVVILLLGHMIRITVKIVKYIRQLIRRLKKNQAQEAHDPPTVPIV